MLFRSADRFGEGAHGQVDPRVRKQGGGPTPLTHHPKPVCVVHQQPGVMAPRQIADRIQRRDVSVHGEDPVGGDQGMAQAGPLGRELGRQIDDVVMGEGNDPGPRQLSAGPDAGVGQLIDEHPVARPDHRGNQAGISQIARAEDTGGFRQIRRASCLERV